MEQPAERLSKTISLRKRLITARNSFPSMSKFPDFRTDDRWIRSHRAPKSQVDPRFPNGFFSEWERSSQGNVEKTSTVLLCNRECSFTCLMCDLWKHTTDKELAPGLIPSQIRYALARLPVAKLLKLYNSGSFFDPGAIAVEDYPEISSLAEEFDRVLVESSTSFLDENVLKFKDMISADLQVAIGLEIAHPQVLLSLNKQMTLDDFQRGVEFLGENDISTRAFILVRPPFLSEEEGVEWACRSIDFAFACGVDICSVIPVRSGNGGLDFLAAKGYFQEPVIHSLEQVLDYGVSFEKGNVFADLWDIERFSHCENCFEVPEGKTGKMNLRQRVQAPDIPCACK